MPRPQMVTSSRAACPDRADIGGFVGGVVVTKVLHKEEAADVVGSGATLVRHVSLGKER